MEAAPGYEPVLDLFARGQWALGRGGGAYAAYVDGEQVVDTWGGSARPGSPWQRDTLTVIMSATKGLVSLCVQILVDEGRIDLDAPVAEYWPEFAANGKEGTTVRHVQLHSAGVFGFADAQQLLRWDGSGWDDYDAIAAALAAAPPRWEPGSKHGYHATSFGWLVGELVRRITGQTIGSFFRERIGEPLALDTWIGTPEAALDRVAHVHPTDPDALPRWLSSTYRAMLAVARDPSSLTGQAFLGGNGTSMLDDLEQLVNAPAFLRAEFPAGGGTSTARSLARVFAMVAAGGELDSHRIVSSETIDAFAARTAPVVDELNRELDLPLLFRKATAAPAPIALGYLGNAVGSAPLAMMGPNPAAFGVAGLGGQVAFCDQQHGIAAAFVRSDLALLDTLSADLNACLYQCAARQGVVAPDVTAPHGSPVRRVAKGLGVRYLRRIQRRAGRRLP